MTFNDHSYLLLFEGLLTLFDCRIHLLVVMNVINSLGSSGIYCNISGQIVSGNWRLGQHCIRQDEQSYARVIPCKLALVVINGFIESCFIYCHNIWVANQGLQSLGAQILPQPQFLVPLLLFPFSKRQSNWGTDVFIESRGTWPTSPSNFVLGILPSPYFEKSSVVPDRILA